MPEQTWLQLLLLVWAVLAGAAVLLFALTPVRRRRGLDTAATWADFRAWAVFAVAVTVPVILGPVWTQLAFLVLSLVAFGEFSRTVGLWRERSQVRLARLCILLVFAPPLLEAAGVFVRQTGVFMTMPAYVILLVFAWPVARDRYQGVVQRSCLTMLGVLYFGWLLGHLAVLMNAAEGRALLLGFLLIIAAAETALQVVGSTFGRRPIAPNVGPSVTVAGAVAAVVAAAATTFGVRLGLGITPLSALALGLVLGVGAVLGRLTLSLIKRDVRVNESASRLPTVKLLVHLDAITFTAPIFVHFMNHFYHVLGGP